MGHLEVVPAPGDVGAALAAMFEARKQVFVDRLGWDLPLREGRYEVDQFDDAKAEYIVLGEVGRGHSGSARLLDSRGPHILGTLFPSLCSGPVPQGPHVREITRFCLDPHRPSFGHREARNELVSALALHARAAGIRSYTAVAGLAWFRQIRRFGWQCRALGDPQPINGEMLVGLEITIGADTPGRLAATGILRQPQYSVLRLEEGVFA
jgi:N-acyl-L-homoserine lactone synthetase